MDENHKKDKIHKYVIRSFNSRSFLVSTILILVALILPEIVRILGLNISRDTIYAFSSAFATAGIVSVLYNYITLEETREIIAETLLLDLDVQQELLKHDKVEQLLDTSLTTIIGNQLKNAIKKTLLDNIRQYKNTTRQSYSLNVALRMLQVPHEIRSKLPTLSEYLEKSFYQVEILSKFYELVPPNVHTIRFVATSNDKKYQEAITEASKSNTLLYLYYLPGGIGSALDSNNNLIEKDAKLKEALQSCIFDIKDLEISGITIDDMRISKQLTYDKEGVTVEISIEIPSPSQSRFVKIAYQITTVLSKFENVFYQEFVRPYSSIDVWLDYENTDILWAEPYISFTSAQEPTVQRSADTRKVHVFIDDWVLPHSMIVFVLQRDECNLTNVTRNQDITTPCREFYKFAFTEVKKGNPKYNLEWVTTINEEDGHEKGKAEDM